MNGRGKINQFKNIGKPIESTMLVMEKVMLVLIMITMLEHL